jgi:hypothetical protein
VIFFARAMRFLDWIRDHVDPNKAAQLKKKPSPRKPLARAAPHAMPLNLSG